MKLIIIKILYFMFKYYIKICIKYLLDFKILKSLKINNKNQIEAKLRQK